MHYTCTWNHRDGITALDVTGIDFRWNIYWAWFFKLYSISDAANTLTRQSWWRITMTKKRGKIFLNSSDDGDGILPRVGVTKPIFSVPLFSYFFRIAKIHVSYWISRSYQTGVAAAQLLWRCQIWMWYKESNRYFGRIENLAYGGINERSFRNPHPRFGVNTLPADVLGPKVTGASTGMVLFFLMTNHRYCYRSINLIYFGQAKF